MKSIPYSILELAVVTEDGNPAVSFERSVELAQKAEDLGYTRFWLAEHHNMISVASAATVVLIGHIAGQTKRIRVGSGGIMLPNHSSLVIAEQFGTLESLFPNRIDLGVGRAPGTDGLTAKALGRNPQNINQHFPHQIQELQRYFSTENSESLVRAIPGEGCDIPIYILGSSTDSAWLAAEMGLPYAFAGHFAPDMMEAAFEIYRRNYQPSEKFPTPYIIACVNGIAAETDGEAKKLSTTLYQAFLNIIRNDRKPYSPPVEDIEKVWNYMEKTHVLRMLRYSFVGGPEKIKNEMQQFQAAFGVDEMMITSHIYEQQARLKSYEIFSEVVKEIF